MRMKAEHFEHLSNEITQTIESNPTLINRYKARDIARGDRVSDINKRFRWDLLFMTSNLARWVRETLYPYLNDDHIDTALRSIAPRVE